MAYEKRLGRVFLFDEADLEANRAGRLSPEQERMMRAGAAGLRRHARFSRWMVLVVLVVVIAVVLVASEVMPGGGGIASGTTLVVIAIVLAFGALMLLIGRRNTAAVRSMESATPRTVEGPIEWDTDVMIDSDVLVVQRVRFRVDRLLAESVEVGATYAVHYVDGGLGPSILSLERTSG